MHQNSRHVVGEEPEIRNASLIAASLSTVSIEAATTLSTYTALQSPLPPDGETLSSL
jgi:hypothetical protein